MTLCCSGCTATCNAHEGPFTIVSVSDLLRLSDGLEQSLRVEPELDIRVRAVPAPPQSGCNSA